MFKWNELKNSQLKSQRGFSFNDVVLEIATNGVLDNYKHPNKKKYPNQFIFVILLNNYTHYIPYVLDGNDFFLKNIIPSRKLHKKYNKD